ncbi:MAG: ATP-dependent DNA helicase RecQ [Balneolales bacterium]
MAWLFLLCLKDKAGQLAARYYFRNLPGIMMDPLFQQARKNLKKYWGFEDFRPGQDEVVRSVLSGKHTVVLFPTGGGKSLCYQVPATVLDGLTLVISPLVALMQDQVLQLQQKGVPATFINSTISRREVEQRLINARNGMYKLLYCAPERLKTPVWQHMMADLSLSMIAVDEAHCISEWGHDFRPVYRKIPEMMAPVADRIRWMALTATATPEVRKDIITSLELKKPEVISKGFNRPNLQWWVVEDEQKKRRLKEILDRAAGSGLIYAGTRAGCEKLSGWLNRQGRDSRPYHAGLTSDEREEIQNRWISGRLPLVVATNAFGMGIDKPDCRFVVHYDMAMSMEAYYQEAGRAGRDGEESYPILLLKKADQNAAKTAILNSWPDRKQLETIYNAVCDDWQLAAGSEMEEARKVDVDLVQKRARLSRKLVWSGLRIMDQLGILKLARVDEPQVGIRFIPSQDGLQDRLQQMKKPGKRDFTDRLSRMMGQDGHHRMIFMTERQILTRLRLSARMLENGLEVLAEEGLLEFSLIKNEPMGRLTEPRYHRFPFTDKEIIRHRGRLLKKLDYMIGYVQTKGCRSRYIRNYFGEKEVPVRCGKCDNCQKKENRAVTPEDIDVVKSLLSEGPMAFQTLQDRTRWQRTHLKKVLLFMVREEVANQLQDEERRYSSPPSSRNNPTIHG